MNPLHKRLPPENSAVCDTLNRHVAALHNTLRSLEAAVAKLTVPLKNKAAAKHGRRGRLL